MASNVYKKRNDIPDMETIDDNHWYAFTFNPCDKYQYFKDANRLGKFLKSLEDDIFFYKGVIDLTLYPELSSKGRLHVHGYIRINKPFEFYLFIVPRLVSIGTTVIKEIKEEEVWSDYCKKQFRFHEYITNNHYTKIPIKRS